MIDNTLSSSILPIKVMLISDDPNIAAIWALTLQQAELVTCQTQLS
jgi:hypothetical protein